MDAMSAMNQICTNLQTAITRAQANVAGTWSTWGTNSQDQATANLATDQGRLNSLKSFQYQDVLNGDWTFDKWKMQANDILSDIIVQDSTAAQFSFTNIVSDTVTQSAADVASGVKAVGSGIADNWKTVLYGSIALIFGLLLLKLFG